MAGGLIGIRNVAVSGEALGVDEPIRRSVKGLASKRFGRSQIAAFPAPKRFTIIGERGLADRQWNEASIVAEAKIRRVTGVMTRAQTGP